jgi:RecG-like helicase
VQFGGLVLSTIATMPPGRSRVATQVVVDSDAAREQVRIRRVVSVLCCVEWCICACHRTTQTLAESYCKLLEKPAVSTATSHLAPSLML